MAAFISYMQTKRQRKFGAMVRRHKDMIWHVCQDYNLSAAWTVEDAFQEVLCKLWKDLDQFRGQSSERTWVYRVAVNTLLEIKRKRSNQPTADAPIPESATIPTHELHDLERIIESLGEPDTTIVRASLEGFDYKEIAEITQLTTGAVAMRLSRAKEKIKNIWNHE